jgi:hypothetical protein
METEYNSTSTIFNFSALLSVLKTEIHQIMKVLTYLNIIVISYAYIHVIKFTVILPCLSKHYRALYISLWLALFL